jgi:hypothetical protein
MLAVAEACEVDSRSMVFGKEVNVWTINACITADILLITRQGDWKFKTRVMISSSTFRNFHNQDNHSGFPHTVRKADEGKGNIIHSYLYIYRMNSRF